MPNEEREFALKLCDRAQKDIIDGVADPSAISMQLADRQVKMDAFQSRLRFSNPPPKVKLQLPETDDVAQLAQAVGEQLRTAVEAGVLEWFDVRNAIEAGRRKVSGEDSSRFSKLLLRRNAGIGIGLFLQGATGENMSQILREKRPEILEIMRAQRAELEAEFGPAWL